MYSSISIYQEVSSTFYKKEEHIYLLDFSKKFSNVFIEKKKHFHNLKVVKNHIYNKSNFHLFQSKFIFNNLNRETCNYKTNNFFLPNKLDLSSKFSKNISSKSFSIIPNNSCCEFDFLKKQKPMRFGNWLRWKNNDNRFYYQNEKIGKIQWEKPLEVVETLKKENWVEYKTAKGISFYCNIITKEQTYKPPFLYEESKIKVDTIKNKSIILDTTTLIAKKDINKFKIMKINWIHKINNGKEKTINETNDISKTINIKKKEREKEFKILLKEKNLGSKDTWNGFLRKIINDSRYKLLKTLKDRKSVFNCYLNVIKKNEKSSYTIHEKRKKNHNDARINLKNLFNKFKDLKYNVLWKKIKNLFKNNKLFNNKYLIAEIHHPVFRSKIKLLRRQYDQVEFEKQLKRIEEENEEDNCFYKMLDEFTFKSKIPLFHSKTIYNKFKELEKVKNDKRFKIYDQKKRTLDRYKCFEKFCSNMKLKLYKDKKKLCKIFKKKKIIITNQDTIHSLSKKIFNYVNKEKLKIKNIKILLLETISKKIYRRNKIK